MDAVRSGYYSKTAEKIIGHLAKRRMAGSYAATREEAAQQVMAMIPQGAKVYRGGSMSLVELGLVDAIYAIPQVTVFDPYRPGLTPEESLEQRRQGLLADVMVASTNAITQDGKLVNLDGMGNRVSGMIFGPRKVVLVVGMNKVTYDVDEAMARVKHLAAPLNNVRLNLANPCCETGICSDCKSPSRICNMWTIIEGHMVKDRIHVVLVGDSLGY